MYSVLILLHLACSGDKSITTVNATPQMTITSHSDGDAAQEGSEIEFRGQVADTNNPYDTLEVSWYYGGELSCDWTTPETGGGTTCLIRIEAGKDKLRAEARDPDGAVDIDEITLQIEESDVPVVDIISPNNTGVFYSDHKVTFEGNVTDTEDQPATLEVNWNSDIDGDLDVANTPSTTGEVSGALYLSQGEHFISLQATDQSNKTGSDNVTITVGPPNSAPQCEITYPTTGSTVAVNQVTTFEGVVSDINVPSDWLNAVWRSDKDGELGSSTPNSNQQVTFPFADLSVNTHVISFVVTDEVAASCTDDIILTIGNPPQVEITSPTDANTYDEGELLTFSATVSDAQESASALSLEWSIDGVVFSTQGATSAGIAQFTDNSLSYGQRELRLTATDNSGLSNDDLITITINGLPSEPTVSIVPTPAYTDDDITVSATNSVDPEGNPVTFTYDWYLNGVSSGQTGTTIGNTLTTKGDEWSVYVTPSDGISTGTTGSATLVIANTPPEISSISISPSSGVTTSTLLSCIVTAQDADDGLPSIAHSWTNDTTGQVIGTSATLQLLPSMVAPTDIVSCNITATDVDNASTISSDSVSIDNSLPIASSLSISPASIYTNDTVTASVLVNDADNSQTLSTTYEWHVISAGVDSIVQTGTLNTLNGSLYFDSTDQIYAIVTPYDGMDYGVPVTSATAVVSNSPPTAPDISISPNPAIAGVDSLLCSITTESADDDGESIIYTYEWTYDGLIQQTTVSSTLSDTLSASMTSEGTWTCEVTPNDGTDNGLSTIATSLVNSNCSSLSFNGSSDYVEVPMNSQIPTGNSARSFALWFYPTQDTTTNLVSWGDGNNSDQRFSIHLLTSSHPINSLGSLALRFIGQQNDHFLYPVSLEEWTHVVMTYDGLTVKMYVNGTLVDSAGTSLNTSSAYPLMIGTNTLNRNDEYYEGEIASAALWNRDININEVSDLYNLGIVSPVNLIANWNFNGTGTTLSDITGNGLDGTIYGATWENTCPEEDLDGDGTPAWQDCDDSDATLSTPGSGNSSTCSGDSCWQILQDNPLSGDGSYWIDPDGTGAIEAYCDMTTEGGGWTRIFLATSNNHNSGTSGISYQIDSPTLLNNATEAMSAYVSATDSTLLEGDYATFAFPADWRSQAPMQYSTGNTSTEIFINGQSVGTETIYYGTCDYQTPCGNNWGSCSSSWLHGRICISNTTAPYWGMWSGPNSAYTDWCSVSNISGNPNAGTQIELCTDNQRLYSILLR